MGYPLGYGSTPCITINVRNAKNTAVVAGDPIALRGDVALGTAGNGDKIVNGQVYDGSPASFLGIAMNDAAASSADGTADGGWFTVAVFGVVRAKVEGTTDITTGTALKVNNSGYLDDWSATDGLKVALALEGFTTNSTGYIYVFVNAINNGATSLMGV